eukprot:2537210-Rhodomonas_salina.1
MRPEAENCEMWFLENGGGPVRLTSGQLCSAVVPFTEKRELVLFCGVPLRVRLTIVRHACFWIRGGGPGPAGRSADASARDSLVGVEGPESSLSGSCPDERTRARASTRERQVLLKVWPVMHSLRPASWMARAWGSAAVMR